MSFFKDFMFFSGGNFSGKTPPISFMVCLTLLPTVKWVVIARLSLEIFSLVNFSSVWVILKRLAANSVAPALSSNSPLSIFLYCSISDNDFPYKPRYPASLK